MTPVHRKLLTAALIAILPLAGGCSKNEPAPASTASAQAETAISAQTAADPQSDQNPSTPEPEETPAEQTNQSVAPASQAKTKTVGDFDITLSNAYTLTASDPFTPSEGNIFVVTVFSVKNNSSEAFEVSSGTNFGAVADGTDIYQAWICHPEDIEWIDGTVNPGETITGCVCFEAPADFSEISVSFFPEMMNEDSVVFDIHH